MDKVCSVPTNEYGDTEEARGHNACTCDQHLVQTWGQPPALVREHVFAPQAQGVRASTRMHGSFCAWCGRWRLVSLEAAALVHVAQRVVLVQQQLVCTAFRDGGRR
jgi:hypothetical protein